MWCHCPPVRHTHVPLHRQLTPRRLLTSLSCAAVPSRAIDIDIAYKRCAVQQATHNAAQRQCFERAHPFHSYTTLCPSMSGAVTVPMPGTPISAASSEPPSPSVSPSPRQSRSVSPSTSPSASPSPSLNQSGGLARASAHKKDKKNVREKRRRGELNRKFDTLRELLSMGEGKSKVEKSQILSEAIIAIQRLKQSNSELTQALTQQQQQQQVIQQQHGSQLNLAPFIGMLPQPQLLTTSSSAAGATALDHQSHTNMQANLLAQIAQMTRAQQQHPQPHAPPHPHTAAFMQHPSLMTGTPAASPPMTGRGTTLAPSPTPVPFGAAQPQAFVNHHSPHNSSFASLPPAHGLHFNPQLVAYAQQLQQLQQQQQQLLQQHNTGITTAATIQLMGSMPHNTPLLSMTPSPQTITRTSSQSSHHSTETSPLVPPR